MKTLSKIRLRGGLFLSKQLTKEEQQALLEILEDRFNENMHRHPKQTWKNIEAKLNGAPEKLWSLNEMERTGGEPDVVGNYFTFMDCSAESPKGRRSVSYDRPALDSRKKNKPENDAKTMASEMGIDLLTEEEYRNLQSLEEFDLKTSTWIETPKKIRDLGGALFCDRRYDTVFVYHNGAESYYASRGFRGKLEV